MTVRFCARCGAATVSRVPDGDDHPRDVCTACGHVHYVNPKIVVGAVCVRDDRLLLCRRAIEPRRGFWTVPAGFMEVDETAEEGACREAFEEARARIEILGLLACYSLKRIDQVQLLFAARLEDTRVAAGPETLEVALVPWSAVPWDDLAFPTVRWVLEEARSRGLATGGTAPRLADLPLGPKR